jgi:hypothetical protein
MTTSLNRIKDVEAFLTGALSAEDALIFHATFLVDGLLKKDVRAQQRVYEAIRLYGRESRKMKMQELHRRFFFGEDHYQFRKQVMEIFSNPQ